MTAIPSRFPPLGDLRSVVRFLQALTPHLQDLAAGAIPAEYIVRHDKGTRDVRVTVYNLDSLNHEEPAGVVIYHDTPDQVVVIFTAPTTDRYRVIVSII